jgi:hypothetical protein
MRVIRNKCRHVHGCFSLCHSCYSFASISTVFLFLLCTSATTMILLPKFRFVPCHFSTSTPFLELCLRSRACAPLISVFLPIFRHEIRRSCWGLFPQALSRISNTAFPCSLLYCTTLSRHSESLPTQNLRLSLQILDQVLRHKPVRLVARLHTFAFTTFRHKSHILFCLSSCVGLITYTIYFHNLGRLCLYTHTLSHIYIHLSDLHVNELYCT